MAKKKPDPEQTEQAPDVQNDEFRGMGGSYVIDPATGKRTRIAGNVVELTVAAYDEDITDEI